MGLKCQINKDNTGRVVSVTAPNGQSSILYGNAAEITHTDQDALDIWSTAYVKDFKDYYGDWEARQRPNQNLDENGEPIINDVLRFLHLRAHTTIPMDKTDIKDIRNFALSNGLTDMSQVTDAIANSFLVGNEIIVNRQTLALSGLYTGDEIDYIMANPAALERIRSLMNKIYGYGQDGKPVASTEYYMSSEETEDDLLFSDEIDPMGKRIALNPSEVEFTIGQVVGGIKDRTSFDEAFQMVPYGDIVELYNDNEGFADDMFNTYSKMARIQEINIDDDIVADRTTSSMESLMAFSYPNPTYVENIRDRIEELMIMSEEDWADSESVKDNLQQLERVAANFGIDITGLRDLYNQRSKAEFDDFLASLDVFIINLNSSYMADYELFSQDLDAFRGGVENRVQILDISEQDQDASLVYYDGPIKDNSILYNRYGLLSLGNGVFHRVDTEVTTQELYDTLYEIATVDSSVLPVRAYTPAAVSKGEVSESKLRDPANRQNVMAAIRKYIASYTSKEQTEDMTLQKAIFGHPLSQEVPNVDVQREYDRYMELKGNHPDYNFIYDFYGYVLREKAKDSRLYNEVLKNFEIDPYRGVTIRNYDVETLKNIDLLMPEGSMRNRLKNYALESNDPSMKNLFFIQPYDLSMADREFYRQLYTLNPDMLPQYSGDTFVRSDNRLEAYSMEDFIKSDGVIFVRVAENGGLGIYEIASTEIDEVNKDLTPESMDKYSTVAFSSVKSEYKMDKSEQERYTCQL